MVSVCGGDDEGLLVVQCVMMMMMKDSRWCSGQGRGSGSVLRCERSLPSALPPARSV